jgi:hypothetical protein
MDEPPLEAWTVIRATWTIDYQPAKSLADVRRSRLIGAADLTEKFPLVGT